MNIGAVEANDTMMVGSAAATVPKQPVGSSRVAEGSGGDTEPSSRELRRIIENMQEQLNSMNVSLHYSAYGNRSEKMAVAVVNKETGEVIREIPSKEMQNLYAKMSELTGMIFNRQI